MCKASSDRSHPAKLTPDSLPRFASTWRWLVVEKLPFFALAVVSCVLTVLAQDKGHSLAKADGLPMEYRAVNAVASYVKYPVKMLWPTKLAVFYPFPPEMEWELATLAGVVIASASGAAIYLRKSKPYLLTGWFWYLGTLVPVIGLVQVGGQGMADRYTYIPGIGFFIALTWLLTDVTTKLPMQRLFAGVVAVGVLATSFVVSMQQITTWRNSKTLFEHACQVTERIFWRSTP